MTMMSTTSMKMCRTVDDFIEFFWRSSSETDTSETATLIFSIFSYRASPLEQLRRGEWLLEENEIWALWFHRRQLAVFRVFESFWIESLEGLLYGFHPWDDRHRFHAPTTSIGTSSHLRNHGNLTSSSNHLCSRFFYSVPSLSHLLLWLPHTCNLIFSYS